MEESVRCVWEELPAQKAQECLELLARIFTNILNDPTEAKFRLLKKSSSAVSKKLAVSRSAMSLLLQVGFEEQVDAYVFPEDAAFEYMSSTLEAVQAMLLHSRLEAVEISTASVGAAASDGPPPTASDAVRRQQALDSIRQRRAEAAGKDQEGARLADVRQVQRDKYLDHEFNAALEGAAPCVSVEGSVGREEPGAAVPEMPVEVKQKHPVKRTNRDFVSRSEVERNKGKVTDSLADIAKMRAARFKDHKSRPDEEDAGESSSATVSAAAGISTDASSTRPGTAVSSTTLDSRSAAGATGSSGSGSWAAGSSLAGWLPDSAKSLVPDWLGGSPGKQGDSTSVLTPEQGNVRTIKF